MHLDEELDQTVDLGAVTTPAADRHAGVRAIAHQLNNTLVPLLILGSLLADSMQDPAAKHDMDQWVDSAMKARDQVKSLFAEINRLDSLPESGAPALRPTDEAGPSLPLGTGAPS